MNYNKIAKNYELFTKTAVTDKLLGYNVVLKLLKPLKEKLVLDYGCGTGNFSNTLRNKGARVIGVDICKKMLAIARKKKSKNIKYKLIKNENLDFIKKETVDLAVSTFVFCSINSKKKILKILKEMNRILKKGGKTVFLNANWEKFNGKESLCSKLLYVKHPKSGKKVVGILKAKKPVVVYDYFWSKQDYLGLLKKANFKIHKILEPKAKGSKHKWLDEAEYSPYLIISAKKI